MDISLKRCSKTFCAIDFAGHGSKPGLSYHSRSRDGMRNYSLSSQHFVEAHSSATRADPEPFGPAFEQALDAISHAVRPFSRGVDINAHAFVRRLLAGELCEPSIQVGLGGFAQRWLPPRVGPWGV